jgi:Tudor domain
MFTRATGLVFRSRSLTQKVWCHASRFCSCVERFLVGIASLEKLMRDFSLHHQSTASASNSVPKGGDLVSAKFSDGSWYRAKIRRASPIKKEAEVTFIDYGNQDVVAFANIRPLDPKFRSLPGQAHESRLRCISFCDCFYQHLKILLQFHQISWP